MLGREPYETRFQGGTEIRGFNQIAKFLRHITPQNKLYCFREKKFGGLGALHSGRDVVSGNGLNKPLLSLSFFGQKSSRKMQKTQ